MNINIAKADIVQGVNIVQKAVSTKSPLLMLQSILLKAENGKLLFAGTDLEIGIKYSIAADIIEEGSILVPARLFSEIVRRVPDEIIKIETSGQSATIKYTNSSFTINGYDPEEYPEIGGFNTATSLNIPGLAFKNIVRQTAFACKTDDEKGSVFSGILAEVNDDILTMVGTDTHRLALSSGNIPATEEHTSWIVPSKAMQEVSRLLQNEDILTIEGASNASRLIFKFNDIEIITRLIEGKYPNHKQVIPTSCNTKIYFDRLALLESVERVALLSRDTYLKTSIVRFNIEAEQIVINQTSEMGKIVENIPIELEGKELALSFNVRYVIDALKNIETEKALMETSGPFNPCVFRPENDDKYLCLVLPLRY